MNHEVQPQGLRSPIHEPLNDEVRALAEDYAARRNTESLSMQDPYFVATKDPVQHAHHMSEVLRLEKEFPSNKDAQRNEEKLLSDAFEHVIVQRLNGPSHWLGEHMKAQLTAPFDDFVNKVDLYIEDTRGSESKPIGLSIDVTFSSSPTLIKGKISDLKYRMLDDGRLAQLQYHKPLGEHTQATPTTNISLPKVIVGIDRARVIESIKTLSTNEKEHAEGEIRDWMTGITILYQIAEQLRAYLWYSENKINAQEKPHVAATIERYQEVLKDVEGVFTTMHLDYSRVRDHARQSSVTRTLEQALSQELGYSPESTASTKLAA